jgi:hypothetical protein
MPKKLGNLNIFSIEEIKKEFNVTDRTLRKYMKNGALRARKIGGAYYVLEEDFVEFFRSAEYPARKTTNAKKKPKRKGGKKK